MTIPDADKIRISAAAKLLGVSREAVRVAMVEGRLPRDTLAGAIFTSRESVLAYKVNERMRAIKTLGRVKGLDHE